MIPSEGGGLSKFGTWLPEIPAFAGTRPHGIRVVG